jgi:RNA polymerase sigma-70 factor (ECF subfamily)
MVGIMVQCNKRFVLRRRPNKFDAWAGEPPPAGRVAAAADRPAADRVKIPSMQSAAATDIRKVVADVYRTESRRVLATLIRLLGDFDVAEEAVHDAFVAAVEQWPGEGVPANPRAWLVSTGRFKAIDRLRRRAKHEVPLDEAEAEAVPAPAADDTEGVEDDRLRLIFTCCHPALAPEAQVALTLREVCGLTTEEIAHAHLVPAPTVAQRIVRAKAKIRDARIPYEVPGRGELEERLASVLRVIYLVFNEGYFASSGDALTRHDLSGEALRLGRLLVELLPEPDAVGLLALMLLHESRRPARASASGELVLLADQDRSLWNRAQIADAVRFVEGALASRRFGPYTIQAAIAAVHAQAPSAEATDWPQIAGLYDVLMEIEPSPVVELNRAVAIAMRDGPAAGVALIDAILARGDLADYHLAHAARADLCRRLGRAADARDSYRKALALSSQGPERRFIERRLAELG